MAVNFSYRILLHLLPVVPLWMLTQEICGSFCICINYCILFHTVRNLIENQSARFGSKQNAMEKTVASFAKWDNRKSSENLNHFDRYNNCIVHPKYFLLCRSLYIFMLLNDGIKKIFPFLSKSMAIEWGRERKKVKSEMDGKNIQKKKPWYSIVLVIFFFSLNHWSN